MNSFSDANTAHQDNSNRVSQWLVDRKIREALGRPPVTGNDQFMVGNSPSHKRFFNLGVQTKNEITQTNFFLVLLNHISSNCVLGSDSQAAGSIINNKFCLLCRGVETLPKNRFALLLHFPKGFDRSVRSQVSCIKILDISKETLFCTISRSVSAGVI